MFRVGSGALRLRKRAAIDVVIIELQQNGLQLLCSLIHDSQEDKKEFIMDLKQNL